MFFKISKLKGTTWALHYNERKVQQEKASLLYAGNFIKEAADLSLEDKNYRFDQRTSLREGVTVNAMHINLNFHPNDVLDKHKLLSVTRSFMDGIGMENQPYLVYQHHDTAQPHLHILTVTIREDGSKILFSKSDLYRFHKMSRQLENEFGLHQRPSIKEYEEGHFSVTHARKVVHGNTSLKPAASLKPAISDVLNMVVSQYCYTSLSELNAVLSLYQVQACRGNDNSRLYQHKGLIYHAINKQQHTVGKGIKASSFALKPTLSRLEQKFRLNQAVQKDLLPKIKTSINWSLREHPSWKGFRKKMAGEGIHVVTYKEKKDDQPEVYFIDPSTKCSVAGTTLGEKYSLSVLKEKCPQEDIRVQEELHHRLRHSL